MDRILYELSGIPFTSYRPIARIPKSIVTTNWPTASHPESNQRVVYSAWDNSTLVSPDTSQSIALHDLYHIAFLLHRVLIPDLVPQILREAGLFVRSSYSKRREFAIPRVQSPYTYLVTPPIRASVRLQHPVVKVLFTITARDQGLDLSIGRSHFTAGVVRGSGPQRDLERREADNAEVALGSEELVASEREVVRNTTASDYYETHVVRWSADSEDPDEAAWVSGLKNGDRIAVRARAQWASFENRVRGVEVSIFTAAVVR